MSIARKIVAVAAVFFLTVSFENVCADSAAGDPVLYGFKVRIGGRYDNVRKCVASKTGTPGGIAADVSAFVDVPLEKGKSLHIDLPVMRPILFAFAFHMLQFEPTVALKFSDKTNSVIGWVAGPALGVSLHYGPDYHSEASGSGRTASFFAAGPIVGAYGGLDFRRAGENFNFQLGLSPYVIPLFGINDPGNHRGIVAGALADCVFRYGKRT